MPSTGPADAGRAGARPAPAGSEQLAETARPALAASLRLQHDEVRGQHVLLGPESVLVLNPTGAAILQLCDGRSTTAEIVEQLRGRFDGVRAGEVRAFLAQLVAKRCLEVEDVP